MRTDLLNYLCADIWPHGEMNRDVYLFNDAASRVKRLTKEKRRIDEEIKKLKKEDLVLEEMFYETLKMIQQKIEEMNNEEKNK